MPKETSQLIYSCNSTNTLQCLYCKSEFTPKRKDSKYCCRQHKDKNQQLTRKAHRKKTCRKTSKEKLRAKFNKLIKSSYGLWLASNIKRAGTVEIFKGFSRETLHELYELKKKATSFSGFDAGKPTGYYHLSHVFSAKGNKNSIGTLHPSNLIIAPSKWNLENSTTAIDGTGNSISKLDLSKKWEIRASASVAEILGKLKSYLGKEFDCFLRSVQLGASQKDQLIKKLSGATSGLEDKSIDELKELARLNDVHVFNKTSSPAPEHHVLYYEFERLQNKSNWTFWIINQKILSESNYKIPYALIEKNTPEDYMNFVCRQALNYLHGKKVEVIFNGKPAVDYYRIPMSLRELFSENLALTPLDLHMVVMRHYKDDADLQKR